ncbi:MAG: cell wall-binding repeat-containing protein [Actinomycetota bacterium]|nr:cell wall-binding repeat-containing protein [Actinomycetota bacterium]
MNVGVLARHDRGALSTLRPLAARSVAVVVLVANMVLLGGSEPAAGHAACTVPTTATVRGKAVEFDQCYDRPFTHNGTNYRIHAYYTEQDSATNLAQCDATDAAGRCEHAIGNNDDANGDNVNAVAMAAEAEAAVRFYIDRNISMLPAGGDELNVYIAEDPRLGGVIYPNSIYVDDDAVDNNDVLQKRVLAFHEGMHLVHDKYDSMIGFIDWYGEGGARATEDRVDAALDADTGHLFIPEVNGILANDAQRSGDFLSTSYRSVLWWTWLMDRYRAAGDADPVVGWAAYRDFLLELDTEDNQLDAVADFIASRGSSFAADFVDYSLSLYAYKYAPADERLGYLDAEVNATAGLSGHTVLTGGPAFGTVSPTMVARSSRYYEFNPASQCDYTSFTFDGGTRQYAFSVLAVDDGSIVNRATSVAQDWARTVRTAEADRVVGVVTSVDQAGQVDVGRGCVTPSINIKRPTTSGFATVGTADAPRRFIVRLGVTGQDGSPVAGLSADAFSVDLQLPGGAGPFIPATVISAAYVQDDYWLLVQAPDQAAGAQTGQFYNLRVQLDTAASDTEASSVLYVERTQDTVVVLDRSGSMAEQNKIDAAQNAASLFVNELADIDQGGYVAFDQDPYLRHQLVPVGTGTNRDNLQTAIYAEFPGGATSIGDGMRLGAEEEATRGRPDTPCNLVLLSDGHENSPEFWDDVRPEVIDNQCAMHVVGLGSGANEVLLQQIAASVPGVGGSYDYADVAEDVAPGAGFSALGEPISWENNLSRVYEYIAAQTAGRQRIFSDVQPAPPPIEPRAVSYQQEPGHQFFVDDSSEELVVTAAWQFRLEGECDATQLFDPAGNPVDPALRRCGSQSTNEVWQVPNPTPGVWSLQVDAGLQEYYVAASAVTQYELLLFTGTPVERLEAGVEVPIVAMFAGDGAPLTGAEVVAEVTDPLGGRRTVTLHDDGAHGDAEPDDGVYAGVYTATSQGDLIEPDPADVVDGQEPAVVGSYRIDASGVLGDIVREAQTSFALQAATDSDGDGLPDNWETSHGLDPQDPGDSGGDPDRDLLVSSCEFLLGTDPSNSDTDGGGEADGSEASPAGCAATVPDPLDPSDDRVGPITVHAHAETDADGNPIVVIDIGSPQRGQLVSVDIFCRALDADGQVVADWAQVADDFVGTVFTLEGVQDGLFYECQVVPTVADDDGQPRTGRVVETGPVQAKNDPYEPAGSVLINDGAVSTDSPTVDLQISADDTVGEGDVEPGRELPGTPAPDLLMRLSNSADFADAEFEPFRAEVAGWQLSNIDPEGVATVYVQFMDQAGNVGDGVPDTIVVSEAAEGVQASRFAGRNRFETAALIAQDTFGQAATAILARADTFPDALAGTYLAGQLDAPLLLTETNRVPEATTAALQALGVDNVVLLGSTVAISEQVAQQLAADYAVERIGGSDRFATAALIAQREGNTYGPSDESRTAIVASGENFPDALVSGGIAYDQAFPLLLARRVALPDVTRDALQALNIRSVLVPGGVAAVSEEVVAQITALGVQVQRVAGAERTETASRLADVALTELGWTAAHVNVARGDDFPDALTMGPHVGNDRGPLLLTATPNTLGASQTWLAAHHCDVQSLHLAGGVAAISADAESALVAAASPDPSCP